MRKAEGAPVNRLLYTLDSRVSSCGVASNAVPVLVSWRWRKVWTAGRDRMYQFLVDSALPTALRCVKQARVSVRSVGGVLAACGIGSGAFTRFE